MNTVLKKLIKAEVVTDQDLVDALHDVCDSVHSSCSDECPVFEKANGRVPKRTKYGKTYGCDCFKNGNAMLAFLRKP